MNLSWFVGSKYQIDHGKIWHIFLMKIKNGPAFSVFRGQTLKVFVPGLGYFHESLFDVTTAISISSVAQIPNCFLGSPENLGYLLGFLCFQQQLISCISSPSKRPQQKRERHGLKSQKRVIDHQMT